MKFLWLPLFLFVAFCILVGRRVVRKLRIIQAQLAALRRGDYEAQLAIVEGFRDKGSEPTEYLFFHGSACLQLGRLAEAEQFLRRCLPQETNPDLRTICRDELGRVLMAQERWDEAESCFRDCIAESPRRGGGHRAIAELLLRRGGQHGAARDAARQAVADDRTQKAAHGKLGKEDHATNLSESLAFLAWALAENHADPVEVEATVNEAFSLCGGAAKPILAELHFCAGHAYAALGSTAESTRHFESAAETDPVGTYGRLSRSDCTSDKMSA